MNITQRINNFVEWGMPYSSWYDDATEFIIMECERHDWPHDDFINVMAITSPRISVKRNWDVTIALFKGGSATKQGLIQSTRVALDHYHKTGEIRGPKTSAFARALHGDTTALVLDTWMARAFTIPHTKITNVGSMARCLAIMQDVAVRHGLSVRDAQAAAWAGCAKSYGVTPGTLEAAVLRSSQMSLEF